MSEKVYVEQVTEYECDNCNLANIELAGAVTETSPGVWENGYKCPNCGDETSKVESYPSTAMIEVTP